MARESQQEQLRKVFQKANRKTDFVDELHRELTLMATEKALAPHVGKLPESSFRATAREIENHAASLAWRLHFDLYDEKKPFSPEFLEFFGALYFQHLVAERKPSLDGTHPATKEIQWGHWRSRLVADLHLLQSLAAEALQKLPTADAAPSDMPAVSKTDLVLRIRELIPGPVEGRRGGSMPDVIIDVMNIYGLTNIDDLKLEITVEMVKGILRKETGFS